MRVTVSDEQASEPVDTDRWQRLAADVLQAESAEGELNLLFVDEAAMADLNLTHLGQPDPTDVLSFPIDGPGSDPDSLLGDVVICPAVAHRNAPHHAGTYEDELALLVVHGVLHVLGHDHAGPEEEAEMQALERRHLTRFHR
jgi:probable rRNA maturation factor